MKEVRIGLIGTGYIGKAHAIAYAQAPTVFNLRGRLVREMVADVTPELEAALILAEGLGDRVYINKVETAEDYDRAAALANRLTCPVTAGSLHKGVYLCLR